MRIAQVAPLYEAVPPRLYGGTERIVSYLTEGLVRRGHQVTLFASGESVTSARLVAARPRALRLDPGLQSVIAAHLAMLTEVRRRADEFDVIHVHLSHFIHFPVLADVAAKTVTTPHGRLDYADLPGAYACWPYFPMISISMRQRQPLAQARWVGNVYHGLPLDLYPRRPQGSGDYLAFLGRMSRDKRPDRAIEIARRAGMKLRIAAKIEGDDDRYFRETIKPLLGPDVEFIGEVDEDQKVEFLSNAAALLFPIDWPEPFGLVVIEAMAFGVARRCVAGRSAARDRGRGRDRLCRRFDRGGRRGGSQMRSTRPRPCPAGLRTPLLGGADDFGLRGDLPHADRQGQGTDRNPCGSRPFSKGPYPMTAGTAMAAEPRPIDERQLDPAVALAALDDASPREPHRQFALKHEDCFVVADAHGDIRGVGDGLFINDTRVLSLFRLIVTGHQPSLLGASLSQDNILFTANLSNRGRAIDGVRRTG